MLLSVTRASPIGLTTRTLTVLVSNVYYKCNCPRITRFTAGIVIKCSQRLSDDCNLLLRQCLCGTEVSLVKRGLGSQSCFGSGQAETETGASELSEITPATPVSEFVGSIEQGSPLSDEVVKSFHDSIERFMDQQGLRNLERELFKNQALYRFIAHFLPSFEQSKARINPDNSARTFTELATDSITNLVEEKGLQNDPAGQYLLEQFKVVTMDDFAQDMDEVIGRLKAAGLENNGVLLTTSLLQDAVGPAKSAGWIARHLMTDRGVNPKYIINMRTDNILDLTELAKIHQSIGVDEPLNLFYVDDASYSGSQAAEIVQEVMSYGIVHLDRKVNLYIEIPYMTEQAKAKINQVELFDAKMEVIINEDAKPIPDLGEYKGDEPEAYYGTMIFEHKVPDDLSFNGPVQFYELHELIEDGLQPGSLFPPYKQDEPVYYPPEPQS